MIALLVAFHLVCGLVVLALGRRARAWIFALAGVPMLAGAVALATRIPAIGDGEAPTARWTWVGSLGVDATFRLDGFAALMGLAVTVVGVLVLTYSAGYFEGHEDRARTCRFAGFMCWFGGAMLGLVTAGDVWTLFAFWELTSVLSFLLIGLDDAAASTRTAAQRALLTTAAGGLAMLGGLVCLVHEAGSADLSRVFAAAGGSTLARVGVGLVLVGAFTKSAQFPFHFWLPGAMAAPTPVSAYLHSATMVKAGVLVVARFAPAFAGAAGYGWWRPVLVSVGGITMLLGGVAALRRDDAKQSLAFGTVSQLGLLVVLFGFGDPDVTAAGVALLSAHVVFKCGLFLTVGAVDHATGTRSLTANSGVGWQLPWLAAAAGLCTLSMLGFPLTLGFAAKESALAALDAAEGVWSVVALAVVVAGSTLTVAYSVRLWWGLFATKRALPASTEVAHVHHRPGLLLTGPVYLFGAASLVAGIAAAPVAEWLSTPAEALDDHAHTHLAVWPGLHVPLLLSALALVVGTAAAVLLLGRPLAQREAATLGERTFGRAYGQLLEGARSVTLITQSGSLPVYMAVVFAVIAAAIGGGLALGTGINWGDTVAANGVLQGVVAAMAAVMGFAVVAVRRRFVAVLLLGGVGQAVTVLFLLWGAPDLALTQFLIESLSIVAFLLVLRRMPVDHRPTPSWVPAFLRVGISVLVGVAFAGVALAAGTAGRPTDVQEAVQTLSVPEAHGRNVVNVTLVDFRGMDTLFEITVFGTAALGVANLIAARGGIRRPDRARMAPIGAHSMVFEQTIRLIFHLTLLLSLYVMLRGHNAPGGGFAGGLIAGAAFVFRVLAGSDRARPIRVNPAPLVLIAGGMLLAAGSGVGGLLVGNEFLETSVWDFDLPLIGEVHVPTAGIFDVGVYALVIGVVILVLGNLAARPGASE